VLNWSEASWGSGEGVSGSIEAAEVSFCPDLLQGHNRSTADVPHARVPAPRRGPLVLAERVE